MSDNTHPITPTDSSSTDGLAPLKLTKLEHAALVLELDGSKLIVDPGVFTRPLADSVDGIAGLEKTVAIVLTHEHGDHWTPDQLNGILAKAPGIPIFAPSGVAQAVGPDFDVTIVNGGDEVTAGPFTLTFFGEKHAVIHSSIPVIDNVGVLVSSPLTASTLYYPGDSFTVPTGIDVDVLAVPVGAPWLKIAEVIDFVLEVKPRRSFATHEMVLSDAGKGMGGERIAWATEHDGGSFITLTPGETVDL